MAWYQSLRSRLDAFLIAKTVTYAFDRLKAQAVGQKLNVAMDDRFGAKRSDAIQQQLAGWLRQVADELVA